MSQIQCNDIGYVAKFANERMCMCTGEWGGREWVGKVMALFP